MADQPPPQIRDREPEGQIGETLFVYRDADKWPVFYLERPLTRSRYDRPILWGPTLDGRRWQSNLKTVPRPLPLYRVNTIMKSLRHPVVFHRSEGDCYQATMAGLEGVHTTSVMGVGYTRASDFSVLSGRDVIICEDASPDGEAYAQEVAVLCRAVSTHSVEVVRLPGLANGEGMTEWLERGGTAEEWNRILTHRLAPKPLTARTMIPKSVISKPVPEPVAETVAPAPAPAPEPEPEPEQAAAPAMPEVPAPPPVKKKPARVFKPLEADAFKNPSPLPSTLAPVPPFPDNLLPEPLNGFVMDIAAQSGVAPDIPAAAILTAMGSVLGRKVGITPLAHQRWTVTPNFWCALLYDRASRAAAPAVSEAVSPLKKLAGAAYKQHSQEMATYRIAKEAFDAAKADWRKRVKEASREGKNIDVLLAGHPVEPKVPKKRRYQASTGSVEGLIGLLNDNPWGLMLHREDLSGWLKGLARAGREGERHFYYASWEGTGPGIDFDAGGHGEVHCAHPCLSILGWARLDAYRKLYTASKDTEGVGQLINRFQLAVCPDGSQVPAKEETSGDREAVYALFEAVDRFNFPANDEAGHTATLKFSPEAQQFANRWQAELEGRLTDLSDPVMEGHLAGYRRLMPALALTFHMIDRAPSGGEAGPVSVDAAKRAADWCAYLERHAERIYGTAGTADVEAAELLLARLKAGELKTPFKVRDIYRRHWSRLSTREAAEAAVRTLEQSGYLAVEPVPTTQRGGKPTRIYHFNPRAADQQMSARS